MTNGYLQQTYTVAPSPWFIFCISLLIIYSKLWSKYMPREHAEWPFECRMVPDTASAAGASRVDQRRRGAEKLVLVISGGLEGLLVASGAQGWKHIGFLGLYGVLLKISSGRF